MRDLTLILMIFFISNFLVLFIRITLSSNFLFESVQQKMAPYPVNPLLNISYTIVLKNQKLYQLQVLKKLLKQIKTRRRV